MRQSLKILLLFLIEKVCRNALDLNFLLGAARPFGFLVGEGFFSIDETRFLDKVKAFIFEP